LLATRPDRELLKVLRVIAPDRSIMARVVGKAPPEDRRADEAMQAAAYGMEYLKRRRREAMLLSNDYILTAEQEVERALILVERLRKQVERIDRM